jgi:hypothetical protein
VISTLPKIIIRSLGKVMDTGCFSNCSKIRKDSVGATESDFDASQDYNMRNSIEAIDYILQGTLKSAEYNMHHHGAINR